MRVDGDAAEIRKPADVDEQAWRDHAKREHRHQALAAGDRLRLTRMLREQRNGFLQAVGTPVVERCGFHVSASSIDTVTSRLLAYTQSRDLRKCWRCAVLVLHSLSRRDILSS